MRLPLFIIMAGILTTALGCNLASGGKTEKSGQPEDRISVVAIGDSITYGYPYTIQE